MQDAAFLPWAEDEAISRGFPNPETSEIDINVRSLFVQSPNSSFMHEKGSFASKSNVQDPEEGVTIPIAGEVLPRQFECESTDQLLTIRTFGEFTETLTPVGETFHLPHILGHSQLLLATETRTEERVSLAQQERRLSSEPDEQNVIVPSLLNNNLKTSVHSERNAATVARNSATLLHSTGRTDKAQFSTPDAQELEAPRTSLSNKAERLHESVASIHLKKTLLAPRQCSTPKRAVRPASVNNKYRPQISPTRQKQISLSSPRTGILRRFEKTPDDFLNTPLKKKSLYLERKTGGIGVSEKKQPRERLMNPAGRVRESAKPTSYSTRVRVSSLPPPSRQIIEFEEMPKVVRAATPWGWKSLRHRDRRTITQPEAVVFSAPENKRNVMLPAQARERANDKSPHSNLRNESLLACMNYALKKLRAHSGVETPHRMGKVNTKNGVLKASPDGRTYRSLTLKSKENVDTSLLNAKKTLCAPQIERPNVFSTLVAPGKADGSHSSMSEVCTMHRVLHHTVGVEVVVFGRALQVIREMNLKAFDTAGQDLVNKSKKLLMIQKRGVCPTRQGNVTKLKGSGNSLSCARTSSSKANFTQSSLSLRRQAHSVAVSPQNEHFEVNLRDSKAVSSRARGSYQRKRAPVQVETLTWDSLVARYDNTDVNQSQRSKKSGESKKSNSYVAVRKYRHRHGDILPKATLRSRRKPFHRSSVFSRSASLGVSFPLPRRSIKRVPRFSHLPRAPSPAPSPAPTPLLLGRWRPLGHTPVRQPPAKAAPSSLHTSGSACPDSAAMTDSLTPPRRGRLFPGARPPPSPRATPPAASLGRSSALSGSGRPPWQSPARLDGPPPRAAPPLGPRRSTLTGEFDWPIGRSGRAARRLSPTREAPTGAPVSPRGFVSAHFSSCAVDAVMECTAVKRHGGMGGAEDCLLPGDVILSCNDEPMVSIVDLQQAVQDALDSQQPYVVLRVLRGVSDVVVKEYILP